ncbi:rRNA processing protein [Agyrium rufum]|nr:rRNA processing protein [Agyrium rufum]
MGSSAKKRKDKKADFQKTKLKVGKARPKPMNNTDTSFKAKAIVLKEQSLSTNAPSAKAQLSHNISLLSSRSDKQRKESLAHVSSLISQSSQSTGTTLSTAVILKRTLPLLLDASAGVRSQLLSLFRSLPAKDVEDHVDLIAPYIRAGLTHMSADVNDTTADIFEWLLETAGTEYVSCPGGWMKTQDTFLVTLRWNSSARTTSSQWSTANDASTTGWTSTKTTFARSAGETKLTVKVLKCLALFLEAGLVELPKKEEYDPLGDYKFTFPVAPYRIHMMPTRMHTFRHLNLFGAPRDEASMEYAELEERLRVFSDHYKARFESGLEAARKDGGEVGRAAGLIAAVLASSGVSTLD